MSRQPLSPEDLARLVHLDAATGRLYWKTRPLEFFPEGKEQARSCKSWNTRHAGRPAFNTRSGAGYLHGSLFGDKFCAHVIVFTLHHGKWPDQTIDHINGDRMDNRPENLRDVPHLQNCRNQPRSRASSTGITGVHFSKERGKYEAHITVKGKTVHLGRFDRMPDAVAARKRANVQYGFHENHGRTSNAA
ncbi:MAG TPA: HNH endonuclease signature motif containing protein [Pseudomonas sp.]|nr:HNH endonuclease signature motif containing protein [Pseudomonas sp.]